MEVADVNKDNVTLKWQAPVTDGGSDVTEYVVEMKSAKDTEFAVVGEVQPNTPFYTARDLTEGQNYEFRVSAKNVIGLSKEPAELDSPVTTRAKVTQGRLSSLLLAYYTYSSSTTEWYVLHLSFLSCQSSSENIWQSTRSNPRLCHSKVRKATPYKTTKQHKQHQ